MARKVVHLEGKLSEVSMWLPLAEAVRRYKARDFLAKIRHQRGIKITQNWWQRYATIEYCPNAPQSSVEFVSAKIPLSCKVSFDVVFSFDEETGTLYQEGFPSFSSIFDVKGNFLNPKTNYVSILVKGIREAIGFGPQKIIFKEPYPPIVMVSSKIAPTYPPSAPVMGIAMFADDYLSVLKSEVSWMEDLLESYPASAPWRHNPASIRTLLSPRDRFVKRLASAAQPDTEQDTSTEEADPPMGI